MGYTSPTGPLPEGEPAERSEPVEQQLNPAVAHDLAQAEFGAGVLPGVQPPYFAIRGFGVKVHVFIDDEHGIAKEVKSFWSQAPTRYYRLEDPDGDTGLLTGPVETRYVWGEGINLADCGRKIVHPKGAPHASCHCGFYGYLAPDHPDALPWQNRYMHYPVAYMQGVVAMSGRRLIGTRGLRAERARIVALAGLPTPGVLVSSRASEVVRTIHESSEKLRDAVLQKYPNVPYFKSANTMLAAFPLTRLADQSWDFK